MWQHVHAVTVSLSGYDFMIIIMDHKVLEVLLYSVPAFDLACRLFQELLVNRHCTSRPEASLEIMKHISFVSQNGSACPARSVHACVLLLLPSLLHYMHIPARRPPSTSRHCTFCILSI